MSIPFVYAKIDPEGGLPFLPFFRKGKKDPVHPVNPV